MKKNNKKSERESIATYRYCRTNATNFRYLFSLHCPFVRRVHPSSFCSYSNTSAAPPPARRRSLPLTRLPRFLRQNGRGLEARNSLSALAQPFAFRLSPLPFPFHYSRYLHSSPYPGVPRGSAVARWSETKRNERRGTERGTRRVQITLFISNTGWAAVASTEGLGLREVGGIDAWFMTQGTLPRRDTLLGWPTVSSPCLATLVFFSLFTIFVLNFRLVLRGIIIKDQ